MVSSGMVQTNWLLSCLHKLEVEIDTEGILIMRFQVNGLCQDNAYDASRSCNYRLVRLASPAEPNSIILASWPSLCDFFRFSRCVSGMV
jgi:hypothetical protein